jgi:hypothetical protein
LDWTGVVGGARASAALAVWSTRIVGPSASKAYRIIASRREKRKKKKKEKEKLNFWGEKN